MNITSRVAQATKAAVVEEPEAPASALWLALTQIPRPTRAVPFPRYLPGGAVAVGDVTMWPLTQQEQMDCNAAADRYTKTLLKDPQKRDEANLGYHHTYANETAVQILFRACRNPDDLRRPAFPAPAAMRLQFTTDEIGVLFEKYLTVQLELGPIQAYLDPAEMEALIVRIQQSGTHDPFDSLSSEQKRNLVCFMASQTVSCWTAMSSAGLPLDVTPFGRDLVAKLVDAQQQVPTESPVTTATPDPAPEPMLDPDPPPTDAP